MLKEAKNMVAQQTSNLKKKKKWQSGSIKLMSLSLKMSCMVDLTEVDLAKVLMVEAIETKEIEKGVHKEVVVVNLAEAMEVEVTFIIEFLKFLLLLKVTLRKCFLIISFLKLAHSLIKFTFIRLITVCSMTLEINILV